MADNWFLKTTTLVAVFGAGAGSALIGEGFVAKAAIAEAKIRTVSVELGAGATTALANFINSNHCPQLDADLALTGGDACNAATHFQAGTIRKAEDGTVTMAIDFRVEGSWVPGAPQ